MFSVPNCDRVVSDDRHLGFPTPNPRLQSYPFSISLAFSLPLSSFPHPEGPLWCSTSLCPSFPRLENHGAATGVDVVCTFHSDLVGPGLDRERLFWELSRETHGVTRLGSFTLDSDSLYVNGEGLGYGPDLSPNWGFILQ